MSDTWVVDSSAVVAILLFEPDRDAIEGALTSRPVRLMSMVNAFECYLVARRRFPSEPDRRVDQVLAALAIDLVPVTAAHLELAREAHARFGKGTGHPAGLNMGDCFAYALARERGAPLLYKGGDFAQTDLAVLS